MPCRRVVAFQDTNKQGTALGAQLRDCVCQGSVFSKSAFSVGRAVDSTDSTCGGKSTGIRVTGASEMFTAAVVNPIRDFFPVGFMKNSSLRTIQIGAPVEVVQDQDYFEQPHSLSAFHAYFMVIGQDGKPMNGEATNVQIQWIEVSDSVSAIDFINAKFGGQQISKCPHGRSVLPKHVAARVECGMDNNCDKPQAKTTLVGQLVPWYYSELLHNLFLLFLLAFNWLRVLESGWMRVSVKMCGIGVRACRVSICREDWVFCIAFLHVLRIYLTNIDTFDITVCIFILYLWMPNSTVVCGFACAMLPRQLVTAVSAVTSTFLVHHFIIFNRMDM